MTGSSRVDLRGLPPPEPLVQALAAVEELQGIDTLTLVTERRPVHLLPILLERGFSCETRALQGGDHETVVRRRA